MAIRAISIRCFPGHAWRQQASRALDLGFEQMGLLAPLYQADWEEILPTLPRGRFALIEIFLPFPRGIRRGAPCPLDFCLPGREERRVAVQHGTETIVFAERHAIPWVLLPAVSLDPRLDEAYQRLRLTSGLQSPMRPLLAARDASTRPRLDALRGVLSRLLDVADRHGVRIVLTAGGRIGEFPNAAEVAACLREFRGGPLGTWWSTAGKALALEGALVPEPSWEEVLDAAAGATLEDRDEAGGRAPPGGGVLRWEDAMPSLKRSPVWLVDMPATEDDLAAPGDEEEILRRALHLMDRLDPGAEQRLSPGGLIL